MPGGRQTSLLSFTKVATVRPGKPAQPTGHASGPAAAACSVHERLKENEVPQLASSSCDSHRPAGTAEVNPEHLQQLVAMGFARDDCAAALLQTSHDLAAAVNKLLGGFTAASAKAVVQIAPTNASPKRKYRQLEEPLEQRLARRRVQAALSRNGDVDEPSAATRWPLRAPSRQPPTASSPTATTLSEDAATIANEEAAAPQTGNNAGPLLNASSPEWKPLESSMLRGASRVLIPKSSEPGKSTRPGDLPPNVPAAKPSDILICPLCGIGVRRDSLAKHMAAESVDAPLEEEGIDARHDGGTAAGSAGQEIDFTTGQEVLVLDSSDDETTARNACAVDAALDQRQISQNDREMGLSSDLNSSATSGNPDDRDGYSHPSRVEADTDRPSDDSYDFWQPMTKKPQPEVGSTGQQQSIINYSAMMQPGATANAAAAAAGNGSAGRLHPEALLNPEAVSAGFRVKPRAREQASKSKSKTKSGKSGASRGRARGRGNRGKKWVPRGGWSKYMAQRRNRG